MPNPTIPYFHWVDRQMVANKVFALLPKANPADSFKILKLLQSLKPIHLNNELVQLYYAEKESHRNKKLILDILYQAGEDIAFWDVFDQLTNKIIDDIHNGTFYVDTIIGDAIVIPHYFPINGKRFFEQVATLKPENQIALLLFTDINRRLNLLFNST